MKNIHILPTDKPSRLAILHNNKLHIGTSFKKDFNVSPQHIYITNDEKIKEGDWFIDLETNDIRQCTDIYKNGLPISKSTIYIDLTNVEKIILTTDQDLIKDGVQAIDDEFLEWFVKNPSCEEVIVEKFHGINTSIAEVNAVSGDGSLNWQGKDDLRDYEIIIPKEEKDYTALLQQVGTKQETLEEAAKKIYGSEELKDVEYYAFINGAKWQTERMYSEEEVLVILDKFLTAMIKGEKTGLLEKWFDQFKKK